MSRIPASFSVLLLVAVAALSGAFAHGQSAAGATAPQAEQTSPASTKTFASARDACNALYEAARSNDETQMLVILGPDSRDIVEWTDSSDDRKADNDLFAKKYEEMHRLVKEPDGETTLYIGAENWPLPIPLVEESGSWYFDTADGKQEMLYRRIGQNELDTIDTLHAIADAGHEYQSQAGSGGNRSYAQKLNSDPGTKDGLYWPADGTGPDSPIGPYLAHAGYDWPAHVPLHGYFFRILPEQSAPSPAHADGFAAVAFLAEYRSSGVMTFLVTQDGAVYQKDMGVKTADIATTMTASRPEASWTKVE